MPSRFLVFQFFCSKILKCASRCAFLLFVSLSVCLSQPGWDQMATASYQMTVHWLRVEAKSQVTRSVELNEGKVDEQ